MFKLVKIKHLIILQIKKMTTFLEKNSSSYDLFYLKGYMSFTKGIETFDTNSF